MKFIYVDTETTGLDPKLNAIVQLAYIVEIDGKVVEEGNLKMRPFDGAVIEDEALKVQGRTTADLASFGFAADELEKFLAMLRKHVDPYDKTDKLIWCGQNVPFDRDFVRAWFLRHGNKYFGSWFHYHHLDLLALSMAAQIAGRATFKNFKLVSVCEALGVPLKAHDALNDIRATRECILAIVEFMRGLDKEQKSSL